MNKTLENIPTKSINLGSGINYFQEGYVNGSGIKTNFYWVEIDKNKAKFSLEINLKPKPLISILKSSLKKLRNSHVAVAINTNQFYITDNGVNPKCYSYNLSIRDGQPLQLSSNARPTLIVTKGKVRFKDLKGKGIIQIGKRGVRWHGSRTESKDLTSVAVYGVFDIVRNKVGVREKKITASEKESMIECEPEEKLLGIGRDKLGKVVVKTICTHPLSPFNYLFILKGKASLLNSIKKGDLVGQIRVGDTKFSNHQRAVALVLHLPIDRGKIVAAVGEQLILRKGTTYPILQPSYRKSWSVLLEKTEKLIYFINDARPLISGEEGLNIYELHEVLRDKFEFNSAYICDAGQSSKIVIKDRRKNYKVLGNLHYINRQKKHKFWDGINGRSVPAALIAYQ